VVIGISAVSRKVSLFGATLVHTNVTLCSMHAAAERKIIHASSLKLKAFCPFLPRDAL